MNENFAIEKQKKKSRVFFVVPKIFRTNNLAVIQHNLCYIKSNNLLQQQRHELIVLNDDQFKMILR